MLLMQTRFMSCDGVDDGGHDNHHGFGDSATAVMEGP